MQRRSSPPLGHACVSSAFAAQASPGAQNFQICAHQRRRRSTHATVQNGGSVRGYQAIFVPLAAVRSLGYSPLDGQPAIWGSRRRAAWPCCGAGRLAARAADTGFRAACHVLPAGGTYQRPFLASLCGCGPEIGQGLRKAVTGGHFCSSAMHPGQPRDPRRGDRAPGSQGESGRVRHTPRWCGVTTPPVVRFENGASARSLTGQDINDRLAGRSVVSNAALAIRQATARPGFGTRAPYLQAGHAAEAGEARLARVAGQSRGARC